MVKKQVFYRIFKNVFLDLILNSLCHLELVFQKIIFFEYQDTQKIIILHAMLVAEMTYDFHKSEEVFCNVFAGSYVLSPIWGVF